MPLSPSFPTDPYAIIDPGLRWYPGATELDLEEASKLIPPLVASIRIGVHEWRLAGYPNISETSRNLLRYWFEERHLIDATDGSKREFKYFFAQREAIETAIWLFEVENAVDPRSLIKYDSSGQVASGHFSEIWTRYVFKLATGVGKTKVLSLLIAWSYFHKLYETDSKLSKNFLLIAPNIIVLDRLFEDFDGLKIFFNDPVLPHDGYGGKNWKADFQVSLHVQDEVGKVSESGNIFLTNIHRIYEGTPQPSISDSDLTDFFLGKKPITKTTQKEFDLSEVVRGIDDLVILNDEAHHIHDEKLAWTRAIESIDSKMRLRTGHGISAQLDVTATPKHSNGAVFVQTVCSYPLVEAIRQGIVKTPVVPDEASRGKLTEHPSDRIHERYADHLKLGYLEWSKRRDNLLKAGKKPILFIMTTTTEESDEVAKYMEQTYPNLTGKVLVIHTNASGEVGTKPGDKELESLREASRKIDSLDSPYECVVSVLMLREGWDVQNVISMVGLRPYTAKSMVLPEQTLGRGLRRMFRNDATLIEYVSIVGTDAFLDFVESVRSEGVELEKVSMSANSIPKAPMLVEVDIDDAKKDIQNLDIPLPKLASRIKREYKNLDDLDISQIVPGGFAVQTFSKSEQREIVFRDLDTDQIAWKTDLGQEVVATSQSVIAYLTLELMRRMKLVGGRDVLYGKVKDYIQDGLFTSAVNLDDLNVLRNLSEVGPRKHLFDNFADAINKLTLVDVGSTEVVSQIQISKTRPMVVNNQEFIQSKKTIFNRVVGDSYLELRFAKFLDDASDVEAFIKLMLSVHFSIPYIRKSGEVSYYYPDFAVRTNSKNVYIVETKGLEDIDVAPKWKALKQWCVDASDLDPMGRSFQPVFISQKDFDEVEKEVKTMEKLVTILGKKEPLGVA